MRMPRHRDQFATSELKRRLRCLRHERDAPRPRPRLPGRECTTIELHLADIGSLRPEKNTQQRALAGTVASREQHELARHDLDIDAGEHHACTVAHFDPSTAQGHRRASPRR